MSRGERLNDYREIKEVLLIAWLAIKYEIYHKSILENEF